MSTLDPADLDLALLVRDLDEQQLIEFVETLPPELVTQVLDQLPQEAIPVPASPLLQAQEINPQFVVRPHLRYLSKRITQALRDVEAGQDRFMIIEMPPRMGKTTTATIHTPLWVLRQHPDWPIALTSHDGRLATSWGRQIRRAIETNDFGVQLAKDAGAASEWETTKGGSVLSVSVRESFTGRGAKVLVIDDPHKDFADAHSEKLRGAVWEWWLSVAQLRLHHPALVIVIMTRWHEDDLVGRLLSREYEGDPGDWEVIRLPALADDPTDPLKRKPGEPLLSPLVQETRTQAVKRWDTVRVNSGAYIWAALMQQSPSPAKGAIFDTDWWRYWTTDPAIAEDNPKVRLIDPYELHGGRWLDSWDCAFKDTSASDFVVGQRWVRHRADRYLVDQQRGRWSFTATLAKMRAWAEPFSVLGTGRWVYERAIEDKANGTAVIDVLKDEIPGLIPINPTNSKTARARSVTPEIESGNVYLPHPAQTGHEWVNDLISELREFDHGTHDDQVDALTQALSRLRDPGEGRIASPVGRTVQRNLTRAAESTRNRPGSGITGRRIR